MIHAGDTIENPVAGERIVFLETSRETNGQAVVFETFVQPDGFVAASHAHPRQEERFEILSGTLGLRVGEEKIVAGPGETVTIPARTPYRFWNAGDEDARFRCEVRPALQFEQLLEKGQTCASRNPLALESAFSPSSSRRSSQPA